MDFALTDDHLALRDAIDRYCERAAPAGDDGLAGLAELGLLGLPIDAAWGGSGQGAVEVMVAAQALGRALAAPAFLPNAVLAAPLLAECGTPAQAQRWLPAVVEGRARLALACHEEGARDPLARIDTRARRVGDGWRLQGRKAMVLGGDAADLLLLVARTEAQPDAPEGLTLFALEPGTPGLSRQPLRTLDGRGAAHLVLDDVALADSQRLGPVGAARAAVERAFDRGQAALCAESAGALETLLALSCEHLRTRRQFGQPLARFQALQHGVADMAIALEQLKSMACVAALALGAGDARERRRLIASASLLRAQLGQRSALAAMQLHGAMGMTEESRSTPAVRRLLANALLFGDPDHHLRQLAQATAALAADPIPALPEALAAGS